MTVASPVSACLLSWKRPQNLPRIVAHLQRVGFIQEICVWNNNPSVSLQLGGRVRVIDAPENVGCEGRYLCAAQARYPIVYVQDDDVLVPDLAGLYEQFTRDPSRIVHALSPWHFQRRSRRIHGPCHAALVGWGAFFQKDWLRVLDRVPPELRGTWLFRRGADTFFTMLLERHHHALLADLRHLEDASTPGIALWKHPEHDELQALAVREALSLVRGARSFDLPPPWHVVITCHNYGGYLREAVASVVRNDADYDCTIVDDGSTDETPGIVEELTRRYPRFSAVREARAQGPARARNRGIAARDSAFVVLLDADDRLGPDYLYEARRVLEAGADVANPDAVLFGEQAGRWGVPPHTTLPRLLEKNSVHYCAAFRRSYWVQAGGFDETLANWEDYEFWIRLAAAGARIHRVPGDHFFYRWHGRSRSSEARGQEAALRAAIRAKHQDLYRRRGSTSHRISGAIG